MSRNLMRSKCCGNIVRLSDLRGKPIEFRRYGKYAPHIGTRWDCPTCKTSYFAWWRDAVYDIVHDDRAERLPKFTIDLSYYESFNDEHDYDEEKMAELVGCQYGNSYKIWGLWDEKFPGKDPPVKGPQFARHICLDNAEDIQDIWGRKEE